MSSHTPAGAELAATCPGGVVPADLAAAARELLAGPATARADVAPLPTKPLCRCGHTRNVHRTGRRGGAGRCDHGSYTMHVATIYGCDCGRYVAVTTGGAS